MRDMKYDIVMPVIREDSSVILSNKVLLEKFIPFENLVFITNKKTMEELPDLARNINVVNEESMISYEEVREYLKKINPNAAKRTGWYLQQFLKMEYSKICNKEYYLIWDSDTLPVRKYVPFDENGKPYFDMKTEFHKPYFNTISNIFFGMGKSIDGSYISEHMIIKTDYMRKLIDEIEMNDDIPGTHFWEKILNSIDVKDLPMSGFSEFETYGTYVQNRYKDQYSYRNWKSVRNCGECFRVNRLEKRDIEWIATQFDAVSFEKFSHFHKLKNFIVHNYVIQKVFSPEKFFAIL